MTEHATHGDSKTPVETHADRLARALRLTQEYIGSEALPPIEGWEWFDALNAHADFTGDERWRPEAVTPAGEALDA